VKRVKQLNAVLFTSTGDQHEYNAGADGRLEERADADDHRRRSGVRYLIIYPDAGHGGVFQFHADFVPKALAFLAR